MARLQEALDEEVHKGHDLESLLEKAKLDAEGWEKEARTLSRRMDEAEVQSDDKVMNLVGQVDDLHAKVMIESFGVEAHFENPAFLSRVVAVEISCAVHAHLTH